MEKMLLRVAEAASLMNVSRWTIYRWIEEGRLEATKLGKGSLRVFTASLASLVERNRTRLYRRHAIRDAAGSWVDGRSHLSRDGRLPSHGPARQSQERSAITERINHAIHQRLL